MQETLRWFFCKKKRLYSLTGFYSTRLSLPEKRCCFLCVYRTYRVWL